MSRRRTTRSSQPIAASEEEDAVSSASDHEEYTTNTQPTQSSSQAISNSSSTVSVLQWTEGAWASNLIARYCLSQGNRRTIKREDMYQVLMRNSQPDSHHVDPSLRRVFPKLVEDASQLLIDICGLQIVPLNSAANTYTLKNKVPGSFIRSQLTLPQDSSLYSLLTLVLCIIYVNQRSIRLDTLYDHLESCLGVTRGDTYSDITDMILQANMSTEFGLYTPSNRNRGSLEIIMNGFIKLGYLDKTRLKDQLADLHNPHKMFEIQWGTRSSVMLPEKRVKELIAEFYPDLTTEAQEKLKKDIDQCSGVALERHATRQQAAEAAGVSG